jgi:hypothetical protein
MALDTKALRRSDMILCHNIPTHDENIEPAFFHDRCYAICSIGSTRSASGMASIRRTSSGCGHWIIIDVHNQYAIESHLVTSLESSFS